MIFEHSEEAHNLLRLPIGVHGGLLDHLLDLGNGQAPAVWLAFRRHLFLVAATMPEFPLKSNAGRGGGKVVHFPVDGFQPATDGPLHTVGSAHLTLPSGGERICTLSSNQRRLSYL